MPIRGLKRRFFQAQEVNFIRVGISLLYKSITQFVTDFTTRVTTDDGTVESTANAITLMQDLRNKDLFDDATFVMIPSGVKAGRVYAQEPIPLFGNEMWTGGQLLIPASNQASPTPSINLINGKSYRIVGAYNVNLRYSGPSGWQTFNPSGVTDFIANLSSSISFLNLSGSDITTSFSIKEVLKDGDLTFTRASTATFVNAAGLIETSPRNLLRFSEQFENGIWGKINCTVSANVTTSPNGTMTADRVSFGSGTTNINQNTTQPAGSIATLSIRLKYVSGSNWYRVMVSDTGANQFRVWVDIMNGVLGISNKNGTAEILNSGIVDEGNGWFRASVTGTQAGTVYYVQISPMTGNGQTNSAEGVSFAWGAQLEQSSTATPYLPITDRLNHPRIDHSSGVPALLLEPQRTNLLLRSEELNQWENISTSVLPDSIISPDGTMSGDIVQNTPNFNSRILQPSGAVLLTSTTYTKSVYVKYIEGSSIFALESFTGASNVNTRFDIILGTIASQSAGLTSTITPLADNWFRVSHTFTSSATGTPSSRVLYIGSYGSTPLTTKVAAWGAQLELGSYPTSYIPTTTATVTKISDSFTRNNVFTNGMISSQGGTWLVELVNNVPLVRDVGSVGLLIDSSSSGFTNGFALRNTASGRLIITKSIATSGAAIYTTTVNSLKIIIKWNGTTADVFENGIKVVNATSFTPTAMEHLNCQNQDVPKYIKQMALWNKPLTDAQCVALTQ